MGDENARARAMAHHNVDLFNGALAALRALLFARESNGGQAQAAVNGLSAQARADVPPINADAANLRDRLIASLAQRMGMMEQQKRTPMNFQAMVAHNLPEVSGTWIDANFCSQRGSAGRDEDKGDKGKMGKQRRKS